jgi:tRNA pseudouridine55 synthase
MRESREFDALDMLLLPPATAVGHLPEIRLSESSCFHLAQGQSVMGPQHEPGLVRIADEQGEFRGVAEVLQDRRIAPRRLMAAR